MRSTSSVLVSTAAIGVLVAAAALTAPAAQARDVNEPRSGTVFADRSGDMSLLGVGLRTRTFLKVKVYAIGLYVADAALKGPLAAHKGKTTSPAFYRDLVAGDFPKQVTMKFLRGVSADQIRDAFRESLAGADKARLETFLGYFGDTKEGEEYVIRWTPGVGLETTVAGQAKPAIDDKAFAAAVFGIWLGDKPVQEDIKKDVVARAEGLLK
jgi:hypothetical protein